MTTQSRLELTIFSRIEKAIAFSLLCSKMMYANASVEITMGEKHNDLTEIIAQTGVRTKNWTSTDSERSWNREKNLILTRSTLQS